MKADTPHDETLDQLTRQRLARLAGRPVDVTRWRQRFDQLLGADAPDTDTERLPGDISRWRIATWRPLLGLAACLLIAAMVGLGLFWTAATPVIAAPAQIARLHHMIEQGHHSQRPVSDLDQARRELTDLWPNAPTVPQMDQAQPFACCVHRLSRKRLACVSMLDEDGQGVSLMIAHSRDVRLPTNAATQSYRGRTFVTESAEGLNMAMTEEGDRWFCVVGRQSMETLMAILLDAMN